MIRRKTTDDRGAPAWILITQMEHARVAGALAECWGANSFAAIQPRDVVLPTVYRHDDGWADWERAPTIEPAHGRPRSFTEMPSNVAHAIWRRSIESAADLGPLAQYMVAQHFMRLRRGGEEPHEPDTVAFLNQFDERCRGWLAAWQAQDLEQNTLAIAQRAVQHLQMFDALSLTLCCAECIGGKHVSTPGGDAIEFSSDGHEVGVSPWPWTLERLTVCAVARILPAENLAGDEQFRQRLEAARSVELRWELAPRATGQ